MVRLNSFNSLGHILAQALNGASHETMQLAKIRGSMVYLKVIKAFREMTFNMIAMAACLMLAASSLVIFHVMVLLYAPYSLTARIWFTSVAFVIYLSLSLITFFRLYSERRWLKAFKGDDLLCDVLDN